MRTDAVRIFLGGAIVALCAAFLQPGVTAANELDELGNGPKIGTGVASLITAKDQGGEVRDFRSLRGKRGLILLVSRSFDW